MCSWISAVCSVQVHIDGLGVGHPYGSRNNTRTDSLAVGGGWTGALSRLEANTIAEVVASALAAGESVTDERGCFLKWDQLLRATRVEDALQIVWAVKEYGSNVLWALEECGARGSQLESCGCKPGGLGLGSASHALCVTVCCWYWDNGVQSVFDDCKELIRCHAVEPAEVQIKRLTELHRRLQAAQQRGLPEKVERVQFEWGVEERRIGRLHAADSAKARPTSPADQRECYRKKSGGAPAINAQQGPDAA